MKDLKIRPFEPLDIEACRDLWAELVGVHRDLYGDDSIGGDLPGLCFDRHLKEVGASNLWVAEADEGVVGLAGLAVRQEGAQLEPLVVAQTHRRQGVGKALLARVLETARAQGFATLGVHPVARNRDAVGFFHAAGFTKLGTVELFTELNLPPREWKKGPRLFDLDFEY